MLLLLGLILMMGVCPLFNFSIPPFFIARTRVARIDPLSLGRMLFSILRGRAVVLPSI